MPTTISAPAASRLAPTVQQQAFLDALTQTPSNITLCARAGCGKTSSILMGVDAYVAKHPTHDVWVCAFNKAIADEVQAKLKARGHNDWRTVSASTVHSAGFGLVKFLFKPTVDDKKVRNLIYARCESLVRDPLTCAEARTYDAYSNQIVSLVRYAKQAGVGFFDDQPIGDPSIWYKLADHFDVNGFDDTTQMDAVVAAAQVIYRASLDQTDVVDFDDMILFPLIKNIAVKFTKNLIFVDEAQDLSRARQALIRKFMKPGTGRIVIVGDDRQAIYGFSGADAAALHNLTSMLGAVTLPLSVTWRCPKQVVKLAQSLVPDLEAAPTAPEGAVEYLNALPTDLTPGYERDAILCRNTVPLIEIAYRLIRSGVPCKVEGRAIGEGLINLVKRWKVGSTAQLSDRLVSYREREMQKAIAKGNESKAAEVEDKVNCLLEIVAAVNAQGKTTIEAVVEFIGNLFADGADHVVTLCTYHRAKGREWKRVILWEHASRCPSKFARQEWQVEQETNLAYVAYTRAKETLVFVN